MPLFNITLPANAGVFFNEIMKIAAFDIIELNDFLDSILQLEPTEPISENFATVGFESRYFLHNLGTLCLIVLVYPFACLLQLLMKACVCSSTVRIYGEKLGK